MLDSDVNRFLVLQTDTSRTVFVTNKIHYMGCVSEGGMTRRPVGGKKTATSITINAMHLVIQYFHFIHDVHVLVRNS